MGRIIKDDYGYMTVDDNGIGHRGPEYFQRFAELQARTGGRSGWRPEGTGFSTVYPIQSWEYRKLVQDAIRMMSGEAVVGAVITADSKPEYDKWGPDNHWSCDDWVNWHKAMVAKFGEAEADLRWRNAWLDGLSRVAGGRGTAPGAGAAFDSVPIDCRTFNTDFRAYIAARPTLYNAVYHGVQGAVMSVPGAVVSVAEKARDVSRVVTNSPGLTVGAVAAVGLALGGAYLWMASKAPSSSLGRLANAAGSFREGVAKAYDTYRGPQPQPQYQPQPQRSAHFEEE